MGVMVELLAKGKMGTQMTKYKMKVQRKKKIEAIRAFLRQLSVDCDLANNIDEEVITSTQFLQILEQTKHFISRLIALLENLHLINQRRLNRSIVSSAEEALGEIQETGEILVLVIRYVMLGQSYQDFQVQELTCVTEMFQQQILDIKNLFSVIMQYVDAAIHLTRPNGQYLFKDELEPILTDVLSCLLIIKEALSKYHQYQTLTVQKFQEIIKEFNVRTIIKIYLVAVILFLISVYELFSNITIPWAVILSITCGATEWFVSDYIIKTSKTMLMYGEFKLREVHIINTKYNGRLLCCSR